MGEDSMILIVSPAKTLTRESLAGETMIGLFHLIGIHLYTTLGRALIMSQGDAVK